MSKSATSFVFLVVLAATITAAFSVYAANAAGNTHAQDWASRIEAAFGRAPSCAEQVLAGNRRQVPRHGRRPCAEPAGAQRDLNSTGYKPQYPS
ncbi:MAG: hypothetical protein R3D34_05330 [Nitratireductor sp.]